jgi:hypothetical protein
MTAPNTLYIIHEESITSSHCREYCIDIDLIDTGRGPANVHYCFENYMTNTASISSVVL